MIFQQMFGLLRYFSIASAVALITVTFALVYLHRDNAMEELVVSAEGQNVILARSFANNLWPRFSNYVMTVTDTDGEGLRARPETAEIAEAVRALTAGLPVLKVKIYNLDGRTIYSSAPGQIGADRSNNPGFLKSARAGKPASKFFFRENFSAFSGTVMNRDLVVSYLPIWGDDDAIEGVFELYTDVTPLVARIDRRTDRLTVGLLITFALLYGILFLIVRRADQILKQQYSDLLESETKFKALVDNSPTKIHIKDTEGRYTLINPLAEKLFGFTDEEARGKTSYDIFPKEVADAFTAHDRQVVDSGEMAEETEQFTLEDGVHTFLTVKFPIPDGHGGIAGIAAIGTDITERKQVEEALARLTRQNELILNSAGEGIYGLDLEGHTTFINPAAMKMIGWELEELIGKPQHAILHHTKPDGTPYPREECPIYAALKDRAVHHVDDEVFWRKDGTSFPVEYVSTPIREENGELTGAVVIFRDITERKQVEEALAEKSGLLETTFESMTQGISVYDADLKLVAFNHRYVDLWRYPPGFIRLGMGFEEISRFKAERGDYGTGEVETLVKTWVAAMRQATPLQSKFTSPDGTVFVMWRAPMPGGGVINTFTDITEQETAKTGMLQAKEEAEHANRTKSEFLANMSHELRTPLNAILGFSELMVKGTLGPLGNPKYQEYSKDINDSGRHLLALIQDILDLSKIEAGKLELDEEDIDVAMTISSCMVLVKERARNGGVSLKTDLPDGLPALNADQRKLKQILVNLLSNAVKFTPPGGEITLKAWWREESGYVFQVIDTGIGIALADIPTALSPFGQVDSALSRKYAGTGLGLPLAKSLAEMHGGSLDLQSEVGSGTTVTVRFPKERIVRAPEIAATSTPGA